MYNRDGKAHSMSAYLASEGNNEILEEEEPYEEKDMPRKRTESVTEYPKYLSEVDEGD